MESSAHWARSPSRSWERSRGPDDFFPLLMTGKLTLAEVY